MTPLPLRAPSRRHLLAALSATPVALALTRQAWAETPETALMSAPDAREAAMAGDVLLLDIRTPDEWARDGVGDAATPLDMTADDFGPRLIALVEGDRTRPVAVMCATGRRSTYLADVLAQNGFTQVINVVEGMHGSDGGPGWLARGLPTRTAEQAAADGAPVCRSC